MYRIILELPFNVVGIWHQIFVTFDDAEELANSMPQGFEVILDSEMEVRTGNKRIIILPFDTELENHDAEQDKPIHP